MSLSTIEHVFSAALRAHHGVLTTDQLERLGITCTMIATLVRTGRLRRAGRGVFVAASAPDTFEHRMALACRGDLRRRVLPDRREGLDDALGTASR